jgi:hypothetical protein
MTIFPSFFFLQVGKQEPNTNIDYIVLPGK